MAIPTFSNLKIRTKLISVTLFLVLLPLVCVAYLAIDRFGKALRQAAEEDLEHLVMNVYAMCQVQHEMLLMKVYSNLTVARETLFRDGLEIEILPGEEMVFDAVNELTNERYSANASMWKIGDIWLSRDNQFVDEVQRLVGGICTVFQRIEGDRLLRVSTNAVGKDSQRDIGTFIPPESPVAQAILNGRSYSGRAHILDDWHLMAYEPIKGHKGEVIGALSVGVKEESSFSLGDEIKRIKVGKTGYVYVMDSRGNLKIHPAREGENVMDSRDSAGFEYIRSMTERAVTLKEGEVGTIRYPWLNPELGEKKSREKINKYRYFDPWDWIIVAGTYEEEIYQSLHETERFILMVVIVGLGLVFFLTVALSKVLTGPIQELTEVTSRMADGDLSQRVEVRSGDEIGILGESFNKMITQIQTYTTSLEKMVEERTRDLKESREKHRELSRFLNSILDSATEYAIMALDVHGKIIEYNRGAEILFGWKKEEVLNKANVNITDIQENRDRGIQKEMSRRAITEGVCELEMDRLRKNGNTFPALTIVTANRGPSGEIIGFVEIVRDLTRRRHLEKELRETKEFLENIMESSVDGVVTTDLKGKVTYLNRAMEDMVKTPREEILGKHISLYYVKGIQEARKIMALLREKERAENYEIEGIRRDGQKLAIWCSLFLVRDQEEQIIGTAGIFKDVTEQKRLEAELKAAQAHLVEASKMRALGELVAGVAHELNNPLMASQTILHVIFKNLHDNCPNQDRLELVRKCNDRIEKIVEHLREFSRQTKPHLEPLDVNQAVRDALLITGQQLLDHNIMIVRNLTEDLPEVMGDSNQLEQVFLNLISNARDAMETIESPKELIVHSIQTEDLGSPSVLVSVKDTGVGIPEEDLDKVLEPFFTTKSVGKGTGLGLSLCFGIVEAHGGRLEIKSQPGKGTEVRVLLPVIEKKIG
ncbi:MAG: Cache 3/Cache 2 fusion domain-containing protein [Deltaproteobacteria bacterium]|nr:Cache 3/Cache 2 fusion domain-containing protein [Deltaproteobacteria bacterium]